MFYAAAMGALEIIKTHANAATAISMGMTEKTYTDMTSAAPWIASQRADIRASLETLCHSSTEVMGLPRFELPAEYVAAVIAVFVHPCNIAVACSWMEGRLPRAMDLHGRGDSTPQGMEHLTASQLFAMVLDILGNQDTGPVARAFNRNMSKKIEEATPDA